jgi:protein-S-isoprenylcysteine O-methyltransferase Ste14
LLVGTILVADLLSAVIGEHSPLRIPGAGPDGWPAIAGLVLIWLGLAVRVWAIVTLGNSFRTTIKVDAGQTVVSNGPYRWIRHPSYTGILLIVVGFGLAVGDWLALALCVVVPVIALLPRIRVEEAELTHVLGNPYRMYQARTKHLIPGLW